MKSATTATRRQLHALLEQTSRTFALAIPLLPEPLCTEVTDAYLLFRIADTFEDSTSWPPAARVTALDEMARALEDGATPEDVAALARRWRDAEPVDHAGYLGLLESAPLVFEALRSARRPAADIIAHHTVRTCRGMASFLDRTGRDGVLRLHGLDELRAYCYAVAGIVGEMLTELFLLECDDGGGLAERLRARARSFGEALQLVNILRDSPTDVREGRSLLPDSVSREALFELARSDLVAAAEYTLALQEAGAAEGIVAFNALPALLATATLDRVQEAGPGSKISRARVWAIMAKLKADVRMGRPVIGLDGAAGDSRRV